MTIRFVAVAVLLSGGVAAVLYGLRLLGDGLEKLLSVGADKFIRRAAGRPISAYFSGLIIAGVTQSSTATSMTAVSMVSAGTCTLLSAAAIVMGANVGTTVTAQIFALTGGGIGRAVTGAAFLAAGAFLTFRKGDKAKFSGDAAFGLGLILCGLDSVGVNIAPVVSLPAAGALLGRDNAVLCFLLGVLSTAILQSSSAVTGVLVLLCEKGETTFYNAIFIILGSNIGSCFSVMFSSGKKCAAARCAAAFNLVFNALGAFAVMPFCIIFKEEFVRLFLHGSIGAGQAAANFHTAFNIVSSVAFIPLLKPITELIEKVVNRKKSEKHKISVKFARYR